jgi:hypothetical protein
METLETCLNTFGVPADGLIHRWIPRPNERLNETFTLYDGRNEPVRFTYPK